MVPPREPAYHGFPFDRRRAATPGKLPSPNDRTRRARSRRRVARAVSSWTYRPGVSREAWNGVGLSPVSVLGHCEQARPPYTPRVGGKNRMPPCGDFPVPCFSTTGSLAPARGRTVTPPALSLPGPFVTAHYRTTLAAYLSEGEFEQGFLDGHGPAQVGLGSPFARTAPFETQPTTPAAHATHGFATQFPKPPEVGCAFEQWRCQSTKTPTPSCGGVHLVYGIASLHHCTQPCGPASHCIACIALQRCNDATMQRQGRFEVPSNSVASR